MLLDQSTLIVVHGPPASGKTRLGKWLAHELHLPLVSKDAYKDELFNHFEYQTEEHSQRIETASLGLLWLSLNQIMSAGDRNLFVESAFDEDQSLPILLRLARAYGYQIVQIYCHADEQTLRHRYIERARTIERHPGHQDLQKVEGQSVPEQSSYRAMDLPGPLINVDTSNLEVVDYYQILKTLKSLL